MKGRKLLVVAALLALAAAAPARAETAATGSILLPGPTSADRLRYIADGCPDSRAGVFAFHLDVRRFRTVTTRAGSSDVILPAVAPGGLVVTFYDRCDATETGRPLNCGLDCTSAVTSARYMELSLAPGSTFGVHFVITAA
jgi:hypothetical protein